jgi:hypothetical protein
LENVEEILKFGKGGKCGGERKTLQVRKMKRERKK